MRTDTQRLLPRGVQASVIALLLVFVLTPVLSMLFASVNEACKILEEGAALRASDVDVMWLHGFGFPRYRGGLMYWADTIGVREVYNQIAAWHQRYGERWRPFRSVASWYMWRACDLAKTTPSAGRAVEKDEKPS